MFFRIIFQREPHSWRRRDAAVDAAARGLDRDVDGMNRKFENPCVHTCYLSQVTCTRRVSRDLVDPENMPPEAHRDRERVVLFPLVLDQRQRRTTGAERVVCNEPARQLAQTRVLEGSLARARGDVLRFTNVLLQARGRPCRGELSWAGHARGDQDQKFDVVRTLACLTRFLVTIGCRFHAVRHFIPNFLVVHPCPFHVWTPFLFRQDHYSTLDT